MREQPRVRDGTVGAQPLDGRTLTPARVARIAVDGHPAYVTRRARERNLAAARLGRALLERGVPVYGRNTGVGALLDLRVYEADATEHSLRLLRSHAGGAGPLVSEDIVRAMLVVRANQLGAGGAGVNPRLHAALLDALNAGLAPAVHELGSIGTGDITALAEAGLALIGEGRWLGDGEPPQPVRLDQGDAIAFISSNAAALGEAALGCHRLGEVLGAAEAVAGLSFVAANGNPAVFDDRVHAARPHPGQRAVACHLRDLVDGDLASARLQDPIAFRCIPQVQGAARDALADLATVLRVELNAAAENPLLDVHSGQALVSGNFHMARLTLVLDEVRAALVQTGLQSVQRTSTLFDGRVTGLPSFLAGHADGSSGGMILEYTANAALEELRATAYPTSLSNIVIALGQENHASPASLAARQLSRALGHYLTVVSVELVTAVRALRVGGRRPSRPAGNAAFARAAAVLPERMEDRELSTDLELAADLLRAGKLGTADLAADRVNGSPC
ncbi:MAG: hypothetical protein GEU81_15480 [Nitriliruptorales bacterium]|nr:hypothetical protein [Nitriliruptorales bacterium]